MLPRLILTYMTVKWEISIIQMLFLYTIWGYIQNENETCIETLLTLIQLEW